MLPLVLLLLGIHLHDGEPSSHGEWLHQSRFVSPTLAPAPSEEWLLSRMKPAETRSEVANVGSWISGLPVAVDVRGGAVSVALKLRGP